MPLATLTLNAEFSTNPTTRTVEIRYVIGGGVINTGTKEDVTGYRGTTISPLKWGSFKY